MRQALAYVACTALLLCGTACTSLPPRAEAPNSFALSAPQHTTLGQMVEQQRIRAGTPYASGFALLEGAHTAFSSRLALVHAAQHTLDLQYYAIHADASTAHLLNAMVTAAQRGVRIRVLLDDFHGAGKHSEVMRLAFVPGIEMRMFNPLNAPRASTALRALATLADFQRAQQRMHNKLFIADNSIGIAGGRNLGDAYFDAKESNNFIDLDVLAAGEVVHKLSSSFDRYWNDARAYPVQQLVSEPKLIQMATPLAADDSKTTTSDDYQATLLTSKAAEIPPMDLQRVPWMWAPAVVLVDAPEKIMAPPETASEPLKGASLPAPPLPAAVHAAREDASPPLHFGSSVQTNNQRALGQSLPNLTHQTTVVDGLLALIDQARTDILIVSPYFVPGEDMKQAFERALQRGVRVRVLTNSLASNDAPLAHAGYAKHRPAMLQAGMQLHELRSLQPSAPPPSTLRDTAGRISGSQGSSRAMLHSKLLVLDHKLTVIGSMNLDMRSQLHNTEVALLIASRQLAQTATTSVENSLAHSAWRVERTPQGLIWRAPPNSGWADTTTEPDASAPLRWLIRWIGPLAPDHLL